MMWQLLAPLLIAQLLIHLLLILEYGDIVWSGSCDCDLDKLDKIHVGATRLTGAAERSDTNILYEDLL